MFIGFLISMTPASALDFRSNLKAAPRNLALMAPNDPVSEQCRRIDSSEAKTFVPVRLHLTFHDDFDEHPLADGKWASHYAGGAAWPEARYWGGDGSDFRRKTAYNGEQQIYVDPRYCRHAPRRRSGSTRSRSPTAFCRSSPAARRQN